MFDELPGHRTGQVLGAGVAIGSGGRELLRPANGIDGLAGVTAIDTNVGAVTVKPVEPLIGPEVAWIVVLPVVTPVARPPLVIVATAVFEELQVTVLVRF